MNRQKQSIDATQKSSSVKTTEQVRKALETEVKSAKQASQRQSVAYRSYMSGRFKVS
jgi:hypothetical protein